MVIPGKRRGIGGQPQSIKAFATVAKVQASSERRACEQDLREEEPIGAMPPALLTMNYDR